ncbi:Uncharacterised protein [Streptococcus gordonii]|nr:Uncharacterised protein [Streptococcus gordonii]
MKAEKEFLYLTLELKPMDTRISRSLAIIITIWKKTLIFIKKWVFRFIAFPLLELEFFQLGKKKNQTKKVWHFMIEWLTV